jgi:hypothetical protein
LKNGKRIDTSLVTVFPKGIAVGLTGLHPWLLHPKRGLQYGEKQLLCTWFPYYQRELQLGRLGCALGNCIPKEVTDWKNSHYVPGYSIPEREIQLERLGYTLSYCIPKELQTEQKNFYVLGYCIPYKGYSWTV